MACSGAMTSVRAFGIWLFSGWRRPRARVPHLSAAFAAEPFTEECIAIAPTARGIYQLYCNDRLIYAGMAPWGIRRELEGHRRGQYGDCTRAATGFLYEVTPDPEEALRAYLRTYMACSGGRLPPCNQARARQQE
jgi:hypothetical protein